ncbi:MAG: hypothetical protein V7603_6391 [Micromonosporaceae bacterium]
MWSVAALALWRRLPELAARLSGTLRVVLRDGDYLLSWPVVAALAPPLALLLGLLLGAVHPGPVFSSSLAVVLVLAAVAGTGAALGCLALVGYAVGDLALHRHAGVGHPYGASVVDTLLRTDAAALDTYLVLAGLVVVAPLVATAVRQRGQRLVRPGTTRLAIGFVLAAVVQALLAYLWGQAAAYLIRPVWSFWNAAPDAGPIGILQHDGGWIALVTVLAVAGRGALTLLAQRHPASPASPPHLRFRMPRRWPWPVPVALRAAVFTLLLSGLTGTAPGAAVVFALLVGLGALRYRVVPALESYVRVVDRVPLVLRVLACCLVAYLLAVVVVRPAVSRGTTSFLPVLVAVLPPLLLAAFLFPARFPDGAGGAR